MSYWSSSTSKKMYKSEKNLSKNKPCERCGKLIAHRRLCWSCYYQKRKAEGRICRSKTMLKH